MEEISEIKLYLKYPFSVTAFPIQYLRTYSTILRLIDSKLRVWFLNKGNYWDWIYIVIRGEVDILMNNNGKEAYIETLFQWSNIGSFTALFESDYSFSCKAKTDCELAKLKTSTLEKWRNIYGELEYYLLQYEDFISKYGFPFCDFYIHHKMKKPSYSSIFANSVKRVSRILNSYSKKIEFGDILKRVLATVRNERKIKKLRNLKHKNTIEKTKSNSEEIQLVRLQLEAVVKKIAAQSEMIKKLMNS